jgi:hypothetical protein
LGRTGHRDAGIVEDNVHASKARPALVGERLDRGLVADVGADADDVRANALKGRDGLIQGSALDVSKNDLDPLASERTCCRKAYTARTTCDHGYFARKTLHCASLSDHLVISAAVRWHEQASRARSRLSDPKDPSKPA